MALTEIPADDLVVQWDVAWEFVDMAIGDKRLFAFHPQLTAEEKFQRYAAQLDDLWAGHPRRGVARLPLVLRHLGRLADGRDGRSVTVRADVERGRGRMGRRLDYVHMPVVRRPTSEFFAPLADLDIGDTAVYLGMVHHTDGMDEFRQRRDPRPAVPARVRGRRRARVRPGRS